MLTLGLSMRRRIKEDCNDCDLDDTRCFQDIFCLFTELPVRSTGGDHHRLTPEVSMRRRKTTMIAKMILTNLILVIGSSTGYHGDMTITVPINNILIY